MKRILCIWLPNWPIQRLIAARPELKERPIVLEENSRGSRRVAACSDSARAMGIAVGMPLSEAMALAREQPVASDPCPHGLVPWVKKAGRLESAAFLASQPGSFSRQAGWGLYLEPYDAMADREALKKLAEMGQEFSPLVGLEEGSSPSCLLLDITGLEHLFDGEAMLAERVLGEFTARRLAVRLAVADTLGAAWAVSHFACSARAAQTDKRSFPAALPLTPIPSPTRGEGRTEIGPARGEERICLVPPGETLSALRPLPVEALRLPEETVALLHQLGIYRIDQLERLPRKDFHARFGPRVLQRWDQAIGTLAEPIPAHPSPPRFRAEWSLEYPTAKREAIEFILGQLIGRLAEMLAQAGRGALQMQCRLDCPPTSGASFGVGLFRPSNSPAHLMGLIRARLERLRISSPVSAVHLEVTAAAISDTRQDELFSEGSRGTGPALALLIDRLAGRLGRRAVLRVRLVPDAQPEFAYRYEPLVEEPSSRRRSRVAGVSPVLGDEHGQDAGGTRATSTGKMSVALGDKMPVASARRRSSLRGCPTGRMANLSYRDLPPRPLKLWGRPVPLAAVSIAPSGPPLRFHWQGAEQRIVTTWGPERIETGWWRGRAIGRDYYHVETATGRRYWLFRRLRDGKWFLHGAFE